MSIDRKRGHRGLSNEGCGRRDARGRSCTPVPRRATTSIGGPAAPYVLHVCMSVLWRRIGFTIVTRRGGRSSIADSRCNIACDNWFGEHGNSALALCRSTVHVAHLRGGMGETESMNGPCSLLERNNNSHISTLAHACIDETQPSYIINCSRCMATVHRASCTAVLCATVSVTIVY